MSGDRIDLLHRIKKLEQENEELKERTTPKKPLDITIPVIKCGLCPNCKGELNKLGSRPNKVFSNQKYCSDCGQAIDWSEEE